MQFSKLTLGALFVGSFAATSVAQDLFVCSQSDMILTRAKDKNSNNMTNEPGEYSKVAHSPGNKIRTGTDIKATGLFPTPALLWLDNNTSVKTIMVLRDTSNDGAYDDSEINPAITSAALLAAFGSSASGSFFGGITEDGNGNIYVSNNNFGSSLTTPVNNGIVKIANIATTPVATALIKTASLPFIDENNTAPGSGTAQLGTGGNFQRLAARKSTNVIYTYHTKDDVVYALNDINNDGDLLDAGEVINFANLSGRKPGIAQNVDFAPGGPFATRGADLLSVVPSTTHGNMQTLLFVEVDETTGVVWLGTRTQPQGPGSNDISGMIFRCEDLNGNGTCNDAGEIKIYVDQFNMGFGTFDYLGNPYKPSVSATPGWNGLGVDPATGAVYAVGNDGPQDKSGVFKADITWKFVDNDADGLAMSAGEQIPINVQNPAGSVANELEVTNLPFTPNFATCSNFFEPGAQNPLDVSLLCTNTVNTSLRPGIRFYKNSPYLGNPDFQVSVTGIQVGVDFAQLYVSEADWDPVVMTALFAALNLGFPPATNPYNLDEWLPLGVWNAPSPMYLDLLDIFGTGTFWLDFTSLSTGDTINGSCTGTSGTVRYIGRYDTSFAVPNDPGLKGKTFRLQWHVADPTNPVGNPFPFPRAVSDAGLIVLE